VNNTIYESCNLFSQSYQVKSIYSTVFRIRNTENVKQLILFNVETLSPPVGRSTVFHMWCIFRRPIQRVEYGKRCASSILSLFLMTNDWVICIIRLNERHYVNQLCA